MIRGLFAFPEGFIMATDYVSDYEHLTGSKAPTEDTPVEVIGEGTPVVETKVITAPETPEVAPATVAEVK